MGSVIRKHINNIYDIPMDVMVDVIGNGMIVRRDTPTVQLEINVGEGFEFDNHGRICFHRDPCEELQLVYPRVVDVQMSVEGNKLTFTKTLVDVIIHRNKFGHILEILQSEPRSETTDLVITDPCYNTLVSKPVREETEEMPNFYR